MDNPITRVVGDIKRMGGNIYDDVTGVTAAERAQDAQTSAIDQARQERELGYQRSMEQLDPYKQMGEDVMFGQMEYGTKRIPIGINPATGKKIYKEFQVPIGRSGGLDERILQGDFVQDDFRYRGRQPRFDYQGQQPDAFKYGGQTMASSVDYGGQQVDPFSYSGEGQQGQLDYTGSPVDRSIESYMQDDPSLAWQQEQMEKALNRQGAAKGRWGGGATAREMMRETAGLLSEDYANRFERGRLERLADVDTEQSVYDRSKYGTELANLAEQSMYDRSYDKYGYDVDRENKAYRRAYDDTTMGNLAAENAYNIAQYEDQSARDYEDTAYTRDYDKYKMAFDREGRDYDRAWAQYENEGTLKQNELNQLTALANYGPKMAQSMANAALGQGTAMSDLAIQQGDINAAASMAKGTPWSNALEMYDSVQQRGQDAAKLFGGGF